MVTDRLRKGQLLMKLLLTVNATTPKKAKVTLAWAGRLGYEKRLFIPKGKRFQFRDVIADVNYNNFLDIPLDVIVDRTDPISYADQHNYDLVLILPENMKAWEDNTDDEGMESFLRDVSTARVELGSTDKKLIKWDNGAEMVKL